MAVDLIGILITTLGFALISYLFAATIIDWINTFIYFFIRDNAEIVAETITGVTMATAGTPGRVEIVIPLLSQDYKYPTIDFGDKIIFVTAKYIGRPLFPGLKDLLNKSLLYVPSTLGVSAILPEESLIDAKRIAIMKSVGDEDYLQISTQLPSEGGGGLRAPPRMEMIAWPTVPGSPVTSSYRPPERPSHEGIDIGVSVGSPIFASQDGIVITVKSGYDPDCKPCDGVSRCEKCPIGGPGNYITIKHTTGDKTVYYTRYMHIKCGGFRVKVGGSVVKGQYIADSGGLDKCRGGSLGAHLHFETRDKGFNSFDPCPLFEKDGGC